MIHLCLVALLSTGDGSEMIKSLKITANHKPYEPQVIYSLPLDQVHAGDLITLVNSYGELTNDEPYNVMLGNCAKLCSGQRSVKCEYEVTECKGTNITHDQHHWTFEEPSMKFFAKEDLKGKFLNQIVYAASSGSNGGASLTVDQDYGEMQVQIERPCEGEQQ